MRGDGAESGRSPLSPARLGRYQLLRKIAVGGMAEIYLARVSGAGGFEKDVVVKRILPQLAESDEFFAMFLDEARIAATLQHPNLVHIYDAGQAGTEFFIAMEYLDGADLHTVRRILTERQERLPIQNALFIVSSIASGLHYAHERVGLDGHALDIVHRDVTPHNVFLTREGGIKLVDFGIAKAANRMSKTTYGTLKGKLAYMSPEQCRGDTVDRRSDIYSLGILLFELTTGKRPYRGKSEYEILREIVEGEMPRPRELVPDYPAELEAITMRALARERSERYPRALELEQDLERFARRHSLVGSTLAMAEFIAPVLAQAQRAAEARNRRRMTSIPVPQGKPSDEWCSGSAADRQETVAAILRPRRDRVSTGKPDGEPRTGAQARRPATPLPGRIATIAAPRPPAQIVPAAESNASQIRPRPHRLLPATVLATLILLVAGAAVFYRGRVGDEQSGARPEAPAPRVGALRVTSEPPGAAVWMSLGPAPALSGPVDRGREQRIRVEHAGYRTRDVTIPAISHAEAAATPAGVAVEVHVELEPAVRPDAGEIPEPTSLPASADTRAQLAAGGIRVSSRPAAATVWLLVGVTPARIAPISTTARHELRIARAGSLPAFVTVEPEQFGPGEAHIATVLAPRQSPPR